MNSEFNTLVNDVIGETYVAMGADNVESPFNEMVFGGEDEDDPASQLKVQELKATIMR